MPGVSLRLERQNGVGTLLIDRPEKRNAFSQAMWEHLLDLVTEAANDDAVRVLLIRSANAGAFSTGADLGELALLAADPKWRETNKATIAAAVEAIAHFPKPVISFIEGDCIGGGCSIAVASDLRIATPAARLGITPAKLGLVYSFGDTRRLVNLIGPAQAKHLLFTSRIFTAQEAERIGLIDEITASPESMVTAVAEGSAFSLRQSKRMVQRIADGQVDEDPESANAFITAFDHHDFIEGCAAFIERRKMQ